MTELTTNILLMAYANGYFPMPHPETNEIVWLRPNPRAILPLDSFHTSRSLAKRIRAGGFRFTIDEDFLQVMQGCAARAETWINEEFYAAYTRLFEDGFAHSIEVRDAQTNELIGGVYGVAIGGAFFAESMFHRRTDMSKIALRYLVEHLGRLRFSLLEVQFLTPHLKSLGVKEVSSETYLELLENALEVNPSAFI